MSTTIIVGGGPAGMMAAYQSSKENRVILIERNKQLGKKLLMTGNGRCNVTNNCDPKTFMSKVNSNPKFLYSALNQFSSQDMMDFLLHNQCPIKEEENHRVFPNSNKAITVLETFARILYEQKVDIHCDEDVVSLIIEDEVCKGVKTNKGKYYGDTIILCTGGMSFPVTGSNGDGYKLATQANHTIKECSPGLVALNVREPWIKELQGLVLKNVEISFKKKRVQGDILFTHFGISGPMILNISSMLDTNTLNLDIFPQYTHQELDQKILDLFSKNQNKQIQNTLNTLLPQRLTDSLLTRLDIPFNCLVHQVKKDQRKKLVNQLKTITLSLNGTRSFQEAMITKGGVSTKEINPNTMESKKIKNLRFAGEIIDVDAQTGGYNLQIAWSTGFVAGNN